VARFSSFCSKTQARVASRLAMVSAHESDDGVIYDSATWIIRATRA